VFTNSSEEIKSSCDTSISSEGNKSLGILFLIFSDALIVNHSDVIFKHGIKQRHVILLGFNGVREEEVSLIGDEVLNRDFFDPEDHIA